MKVSRKKKIFLVDDDELISLTLSRALEQAGYEIKADLSAADVMEKLRAWFPDVVLLDIQLPGRNGVDILKEIRESGLPVKVIMLTADDTAETAVKAMKLGAADYLTKPFNIEEVKIVVGNAIENQRLEQEVDYLRKISCNYFNSEIIGQSPALREIQSKAAKMAEAHVSSILITGESGTGKEVIARYIHSLMFGECTTSREPFVAVNCAALPDHLLESELFGYERGAFTDARSDKKGLFELAAGGTILLDEIGETAPHLQTALLRVLEERTVRRLGGKDDIPIDVAVIATTNRNLNDAVKNGGFRNDLFFRLSTFYLHIPPLRERKEDVIALARHFLSLFSRRYNKKTIKGFSSEAEALLEAYTWPGNARELKNLVERLVVLENAPEIVPAHLPNWLTGKRGPSLPQESKFVLTPTGVSLEDLEKDLIKQAMDLAQNNKTNAAKLLNMSYDSFRYQIKKLGME
ncbi:MAG: sigma-54 dependent transcriptional regulator [Nitrospiraceae bacterium]|nr:sigma-54 dependent transcriptional regulator [Nitrospiraceae bacterium]